MTAVAESDHPLPKRPDRRLRSIAWLFGFSVASHEWSKQVFNLLLEWSLFLKDGFRIVIAMLRNRILFVNLKLFNSIENGSEIIFSGVVSVCQFTVAARIVPAIHDRIRSRRFEGYAEAA